MRNVQKAHFIFALYLDTLTFWTSFSNKFHKPSHASQATWGKRDVAVTNHMRPPFAYLKAIETKSSFFLFPFPCINLHKLRIRTEIPGKYYLSLILLIAVKLHSTYTAAAAPPPDNSSMYAHLPHCGPCAFVVVVPAFPFWDLFDVCFSSGSNSLISTARTSTGGFKES